MTNRTLAVWLAAEAFLGAIVLGSAMASMADWDFGKAPWFAVRAAGIVAYGSLGLSTIWGLLTSSRLLMKWVQPNLALELHKTFSFIGLAALVVHGGGLLYDKAVPFTLPMVALPFLSDYRPLAVGLGILAGYLMALLTWSFYIRQQIGQRVWRILHYTGFAAFALAAQHGLLSGTDTKTGWMLAMYVLFGASVLFLTYVRVLGGRLIPTRGKTNVSPAGATVPRTS